MTNAHIDYINGITGAASYSSATTAIDIFIVFMLRMGFSTDTAAAEFAFIGDMTETEYTRARRIGMAAIGDRASRISVFQAYRNAHNHSSFAE